MALAKDFLETGGFVREGTVTDTGWELFSKFLDHVGAYPNLTPGLPMSPYDIFLKFMSKVVPSAIKLLIVRDGKVFLMWREDKFFRGWHTPGSYMAPGETLEQSAQRIMDREVPGIMVISARIVNAVVNRDSARFQDLSALTLVEFKGAMEETEKGRWFSEEPPELIDVHKPFWPTIARCLTQ